MSLLFLLWLFVLVTSVFFLVRASSVASAPRFIIVVLLIIVMTVMVVFVVVVDFLFLDLLLFLVLEPVALLLFLAVVLGGGAETGVFALLGLLPVPVTRPLQMTVLHILAVFVELLHCNFRALVLSGGVNVRSESAIHGGLVEWVIFVLLFIASMSIVVFLIGVVVIFLIRVVVVVVVIVIFLIRVTATVTLGRISRLYTLRVL